MGDVLLYDIVPHLTRIVIVAVEQAPSHNRHHFLLVIVILLELTLSFLPGKTSFGLTLNLLIIFSILLILGIFASIVLILVGIIRILIVFPIGFFNLFIELVHLIRGHQEQATSPIAVILRAKCTIRVSNCRVALSVVICPGTVTGSLGGCSITFIFIVVFITHLLVLAIFIVLIITAIDLLMVDHSQLLLFLHNQG